MAQKTKYRQGRRKTIEREREAYRCAVFVLPQIALGSIGASDGARDLDTRIGHGDVGPALSLAASLFLGFCGRVENILFVLSFPSRWSSGGLLPCQICHEVFGGMIFFHLPLGCCCGGQQQIVVDACSTPLFWRDCASCVSSAFDFCCSSSLCSIVVKRERDSSLAVLSFNCFCSVLWCMCRATMARERSIERRAKEEEHKCQPVAKT